MLVYLVFSKRFFFKKRRFFPHRRHSRKLDGELNVLAVDPCVCRYTTRTVIAIAGIHYPLYTNGLDWSTAAVNTLSLLPFQPTMMYCPPVLLVLTAPI
jgi:hypothetical protein